jgi:hypothetical protein
LFYRIWVSASDTAWTNHAAVPPDNDSRAAPFIEIVDSVTPLEPRRILALNMVVHGSPVTHANNPTMIDVSYREETRIEYDLVAILPNKTTLTVENVF